MRPLTERQACSPPSGRLRSWLALDGQGQSWIGVSESCLCRLDVDPFGDHGGGVGPPEVVEVKTIETGILYGWLPVADRDLTADLFQVELPGRQGVAGGIEARGTPGCVHLYTTHDLVADQESCRQ